MGETCTLNHHQIIFWASKKQKTQIPDLYGPIFCGSNLFEYCLLQTYFGTNLKTTAKSKGYLMTRWFLLRVTFIFSKYKQYISLCLRATIFWFKSGSTHYSMISPHFSLMGVDQIKQVESRGESLPLILWDRAQVQVQWRLKFKPDGLSKRQKDWYLL